MREAIATVLSDMEKPHLSDGAEAFNDRSHFCFEGCTGAWGKTACSGGVNRSCRDS